MEERALYITHHASFPVLAQTCKLPRRTWQYLSDLPMVLDADLSMALGSCAPQQRTEQRPYSPHGYPHRVMPTDERRDAQRRVPHRDEWEMVHTASSLSREASNEAGPSTGESNRTEGTGARPSLLLCTHAEPHACTTAAYNAPYTLFRSCIHMCAHACLRICAYTCLYAEMTPLKRAAHNSLVLGAGIYRPLLAHDDMIPHWTTDAENRPVNRQSKEALSECRTAVSYSAAAQRAIAQPVIATASGQSARHSERSQRAVSVDRQRTQAARQSTWRSENSQSSSGQHISLRGRISAL